MRSRKRQTIIFGIIGGIGLLLILAVIWLYARQYKFLKYENSIYDFSMVYPPTWSYDEHKPGVKVIFITPAETTLDLFRENVNIMILKLPEDSSRTLKEHTKRVIRQTRLAFGQSIMVLESAPSMLDGWEAHRFVFFTKIDNQDYRTLCLWTLADKRIYQITYTALNAKYNKYIGQVNRMIGSFKIGR
jgi:hypothetical protein